MSTTSEKIKNIPHLSFEDALKHLEETVSTMENNDNGLDAVIDNYEYGVALKKYLQQNLSEAKLKIEKISSESDTLF